MTAYKRSFAKTSITAALAGLFVIVATHLVAPSRFAVVTALIDAIAWVIGALFEAVALGGVIALYPDAGAARVRHPVPARIEKSGPWPVGPRRRSGRDTVIRGDPENSG
jgi:hypothetical protein